VCVCICISIYKHTYYTHTKVLRSLQGRRRYVCVCMYMYKYIQAYILYTYKSPEVAADPETNRYAHIVFAHKYCANGSYAACEEGGTHTYTYCMETYTLQTRRRMNMPIYMHVHKRLQACSWRKYQLGSTRGGDHTYLQTYTWKNRNMRQHQCA
jgi:hypothetical protein